MAAVSITASSARSIDRGQLGDVRKSGVRRPRQQVRAPACAGKPAKVSANHVAARAEVPSNAVRKGRGRYAEVSEARSDRGLEASAQQDPRPARASSGQAAGGGNGITVAKPP